MVSIREWVDILYDVAGKQVDFVNVYNDTEQRNYFSFIIMSIILMFPSNINN